MDLDQIESFVEVVDAKTISAAAVRLNISQSALSRRIQQLERELGTQLLVRRRQGIEPTESGRRALGAYRRMLLEHSRLIHELGQRADLSTGLVRVGGGATAASYLLPPCIAQLHQAHPGLRFYLREAGSADISTEILDGELDLGIVTAPPREVRGLDLEPLITDHIVLAVPSTSSLSGPVHPRTLTNQPVIAFEAASAIRSLIDRRLAAAGAQPQIVAELRSIPSMLQMVRETGMPAFVSTLSLSGQPGLRAVAIDGLAIARELAIARPTGTIDTAATTALVRALRDRAATLDRAPDPDIPTWPPGTARPTT